MVIPPHTIVFDPTKPLEHTRFKALDVRDNFNALSRANDLRPSQSIAPNLTVLVQPGRFLISTSSSKDFAGGNSPILDTTTGGASGQSRIATLHIDSASALSWKLGVWATGTPVAPSFDGSKIALCEVTHNYGDTVIVDSMIRDVRPLLNLGAGDTVVNPQEIQITAQDMGGGTQQDFDTSPAFLYTPGRHELLVYLEVPGTGMVFQRSSGDTFDAAKDYWEYSDSLIRFNTPVVAGLRVVVWRVGLAAPSYSMRDLSDVHTQDAVDSGDRSVALLVRSSTDIPSGTNPYQTLYSHSLIDHSAIVPIATMLTDITTIQEHTDNTGTPPFHAASGISLNPTGLNYTTATDLQQVFIDIESNFYSKFRIEHFALGGHGPKVTITQTGADNALNIVKTGTAGGYDLVNIGNSSPVTALDINQNAAIPGSGAVINIDHSATAGRGIRIGLTNSSNTDAGLVVIQSGSGFGIHVLERGNAQALYIEKQNTGGTDCVDVINSGSGVGFRVSQAGPGVGSAAYISQIPNATALTVDKVGVSSGNGIQVNNSGSGAALAVLQKNVGSASGAIWISNAGTGNDINGNSSNWTIDRFGNINTVASVNVGDNLQVNENSTFGTSGGYRRLGVGPDLYVDFGSGYNGSIVCTHPIHRINCHGAGLRWIFWGSLGAYPPIGTIVYLTSTVAYGSMYPRTDGGGSNQNRDDNWAWFQMLGYVFMGDCWHDLISDH